MHLAGPGAGDAPRNRHRARWLSEGNETAFEFSVVFLDQPVAGRILSDLEDTARLVRLRFAWGLHHGFSVADRRRNPGTITAREIGLPRIKLRERFRVRS